MSLTESASSGIDDERLEMIYGWVDEVPLTKTKKTSISRDFADGVSFAELIYFYFPKSVEMHNYTITSNTQKKKANWRLLNRKVLKKLFGFELGDDVIDNLVGSKQFTIEKVLLELKSRIDNKLKEERIKPPPPLSSFRAKESDQPEADQHIGTKGRGRKGMKPQSKAPIEYPAPLPFERVSQKSLGRSDPVAMPGPPPRRQPNRKDRDLALMYEEKQQECLAKEETILILSNKVRHLENLSYLKDSRITQLQTCIDEIERNPRYY
ncbi:sperm flagellar protein 1-like isoform X2 [Argopecten irradians]|uniref:sperm flagellar protein 1-like isoform X2 n=1 Tax=Argopecten irradians TaxID=31199 RepID=UPI00371032C2